MVNNLQIQGKLVSVMRAGKYEQSDLIQRLKRKNRTAQSTCYREYYGRIKAIVLRYTSSQEDVEEIINSAFLNAFRSIGSFTGSGSFEGWLKTIVKRTAIDHCKKYVYNKVHQEELADYNVHEYNHAINQLNAEDFLSFLVRIPNASRTVFNLFAIEGYSHKEISEMLQISIGTSKWHLSNARKKLIEIIKPENFEI